MDWLSKHHAHMDYLRRKVTLMGPRGEGIVHKGESFKEGVRLILAVKAHKLLNRR